MDNLERAALDGSLFNQRSSPRRRDSLSDGNEEEIIDTRFDSKYHMSSSINPRASAPAAPTPMGQAAPQRNSMYGNGARRGAQTGPKGVINDHVAHQAAERAAKRASVQATRTAQERAAITVPTPVEEDKEVEDWRRRRMEEMRMSTASAGLREVGKHGFVGAVERTGWVCVLIYEPNLPRCSPLLAEATRIARSGASIVRARAAVLGFGVAGGGRMLASIAEQRDVSSTLDRDSDAEDENEVVGEPDPDVLPTLLAYHDGELAKTWVRVDFEVGAGGLEALLLKEGIIHQNREVYESDEER